jgi:chromate transporter
MPESSDTRFASRPSIFELFIAFSRLALFSFGGGVPAWIHRAFVERRCLLTDEEFAATFSLARIMPGTNVVNLAVLIGYRARGALGATVAGFGLLVGPILLSIVLVVLYEHFTESVLVSAALKGAGAGAAGLLIAMAANLTAGFFKRSKTEVGGRALLPFALVTAAVVFTLVGVVQISTVWVVLCFSPISITFFFLASRPSSARTRNGST